MAFLPFFAAAAIVSPALWNHDIKWPINCRYSFFIYLDLS
jgi:hypothetical protein